MFNALNEAMMGKVSIARYYLYRMTILPTIYIFLSLLYLALSCVWVIRFDKFYGSAGYVIYWMFSWIGAKALLFGTKNLLGLNFGVLIAWVAVSLALQPFTIWVQMMRMKKQVLAHKREVLERVYGKEDRKGGEECWVFSVIKA
jgi:hypothetical protein